MGRIKPRRDTPRRRTAPRWTSEQWDDATAALLLRCGWRCEKCGQPLNNELERHHRQRREVGGDRLCNLLALHSACHRYITEHPEESYANGWIVAASGDPLTEPVRLPPGVWWLLTDEGTKTVMP